MGEVGVEVVLWLSEYSPASGESEFSRVRVEGVGCLDVLLERERCLDSVGVDSAGPLRKSNTGRTDVALVAASGLTDEDRVVGDLSLVEGRVEFTLPGGLRLTIFRGLTKPDCDCTSATDESLFWADGVFG